VFVLLRLLLGGLSLGLRLLMGLRHLLMLALTLPLHGDSFTFARQLHVALHFDGVNAALAVLLLLPLHAFALLVDPLAVSVAFTLLTLAVLFLALPFDLLFAVGVGGGHLLLVHVLLGLGLRLLLGLDLLLLLLLLLLGAGQWRAVVLLAALHVQLHVLKREEN
jgi:hypothetical protein